MVLHQCIRPLFGAHAPGHHGNPRASDLISDHASKGYIGAQFSDALGRPILHLFCSLADLGGETITASHCVAADHRHVGRFTQLVPQTSLI